MNKIVLVTLSLTIGLVNLSGRSNNNNESRVAEEFKRIHNN